MEFELLITPLIGDQYEYAVRVIEDGRTLIDRIDRLRGYDDHLDTLYFARLLQNADKLLGKTIDMHLYSLTELDPFQLSASCRFGFGQVVLQPFTTLKERQEVVLLWLDFYKQRQRAPGSLGTSLGLSCYAPVEYVQQFGRAFEAEIKQAMLITDPEEIEDRF
jgi:hypothetical protein